MTNYVCRVCGVGLSLENWYSSNRKDNRCICKECECERASLWQKANIDKSRELKCLWKRANPVKAQAQTTRYNRKRGIRAFNENKDCPQYLGIHVAERVLSNVFKDVERMPMNNRGYDIICNHNKKIDVKSSCQREIGGWMFNIKRNVTADYFLCIAFDNREDLNPVHGFCMLQCNER
jgi:hypothetical protein